MKLSLCVTALVVCNAHGWLLSKEHQTVPSSSSSSDMQDDDFSEHTAPPKGLNVTARTHSKSVETSVEDNKEMDALLHGGLQLLGGIVSVLLTAAVALGLYTRGCCGKRRGEQPVIQHYCISHNLFGLYASADHLCLRSTINSIK
jgi:hypothetical protein